MLICTRGDKGDKGALGYLVQPKLVSCLQPRTTHLLTTHNARLPSCICPQKVSIYQATPQEE